jgi:uncharacterized protein involved in exopolysaccharide biosynthesis
MTMLQTYSASQPGVFEDSAPAFDLHSLLGIVRSRIFYFAVPFVLLLIIGFLLVAIQRPIYRAEGKILVQSPEIPTSLVAPTVTAAATERIQVIQQRLMARDSLLPIVDKFNLFPSERQWMSGTQLLDLMRDRSDIALVDLNTLIAGKDSKDNKPAPMRPNTSSATAFTVSFEYENPDVATKVANEFLTSILNQDIEARTTDATQTTEFLAQEVKRLQTKLDTVNAQIFEAKQQTPDPINGSQQTPEQLQAVELTKLQENLNQASSTYSDEHPVVKALKKRIAALQSQIAQTAKTTGSLHPEKDVNALEQQQTSITNDLDDVSKRLTAARLGESMERNQQSEHLQVIEQPVVPQKPVKPNRPKFFAISFALAFIGGVGTVVLAEMFDKTLRGTRDLSGVIDRHLLMAIPYISTVEETARRRRKIMLLWGMLAVLLVAGFVAALYVGVTIDFSWFDQSWLYSLTRLTK